MNISYRDHRVFEIALADGRRVRFSLTEDGGTEGAMRVEIVAASDVTSSLEVNVRR